MLGTLLDAWYIDTRRLLFLINAIMDLRARESKKKKKLRKQNYMCTCRVQSIHLVQR